MLGCIDVIQDVIDVDLFGVLELKFDGFCNYKNIDDLCLIEVLLVDKVVLLILFVLEMMVLVGGFCVFGVNVGGLMYGVFIDNVGMFSNDYFVNLFDMVMEWFVDVNDELFEGKDCVFGVVKYIGICVDLVFGLNLILCLVVEIYVQSDLKDCFMCDFIKVWDKVMMFDWFDV